MRIRFHVNKGSLSSLSKALVVIETLSGNTSVGITEISNKTKLAKSVVHRILTTLVNRDFVIQDNNTGKYSLGPAIFQLIQNYVNQSLPIKSIQSILEDLCSETNQNAYFALVQIQKHQILVLAEKTAKRPIIPSSILYQTLPLFKTPAGKLCFSKDEARNKIHPYTKNCRTKIGLEMNRLQEDIERCKKTGYAVCKNTIADGLSEIGVMICVSFLFVLCLRGFSKEFSPNNIRNWSELLKEKAKLLETRLA